MSSCRAGSGAIPELQDATSAQVSGARDKFASNVQKTKRRIDGIWGQGKVGLISSQPFRANAGISILVLGTTAISIIQNR